MYNLFYKNNEIQRSRKEHKLPNVLSKEEVSMLFASIQNIFNKAKYRSGINEKATVYTLRHSFAAHLLESGTNSRTSWS